MSDIYKRALKRFLRGGLAGAFGTMLTVQGLTPGSWTDIISWVNTLAIAGVIGFISGLILAGDKLLRDGFSSD